jgi:hypothetical protein
VNKLWKEASARALDLIASDISFGVENKPITCTNSIDFERIPNNKVIRFLITTHMFKYIRTNIAGPGVEQAMVDGIDYYSCTADGSGCVCFPICKEEACSCSIGMGGGKISLVSS